MTIIKSIELIKNQVRFFFRKERSKKRLNNESIWQMKQFFLRVLQNCNQIEKRVYRWTSLSAVFFIRECAYSHVKFWSKHVFLSDYFSIRGANQWIVSTANNEAHLCIERKNLRFFTDTLKHLHIQIKTFKIFCLSLTSVFQP